MIKKSIRKKATEIGHDSYELMNFNQLPCTASKAKQIAALKTDQMWQRNHFEEISRAIDYLIQDIERA